jgi:hypothetical protein
VESHLSRKERAKDGAPSICGWERPGQTSLRSSPAGCTIRGQLIRDRLGLLNAFLSKRDLIEARGLIQQFLVLVIIIGRSPARED